MIVQIHPKFKNAYRKRILPFPKLVEKTEDRIKLFKENPHNPILKDHNLLGKRSKLRSFSITGDIRIIYQPINKNLVLFLDIGSHNQVY